MKPQRFTILKQHLLRLKSTKLKASEMPRKYPENFQEQCTIAILIVKGYHVDVQCYPPTSAHFDAAKLSNSNHFIFRIRPIREKSFEVVLRQLLSCTTTLPSP